MSCLLFASAKQKDPTMKKIKSLLLILLLWCFMPKQLTAQDTIACTNCGCDHDRPDFHAPIGVMIDHIHEPRQWMVSYRYMGMYMNGNLRGSERISQNDIYQNYIMSSDRMNMQMHMLMAMYGLSRKITLMGMLNYVNNSMNMSMMMYGMMDMSTMSMMDMSDTKMTATSRTSGFGDTKLYILYSLYKGDNHQLLLSGGLSLPTGNISLSGTNMMGERQRYPYCMQLGTGSYSVLPGLTYTGQSNIFSWGLQVTGDVKTNYNKAGYKLGNEFIATGWIAHNWNKWISNSIRVNSDALGKINGYDPLIALYRTTETDADVTNTGAYRTSAFAGVNILIPKGFLEGNRIGLEVGIPVYQYVNGIQMNTKAYINAGWQYAF
ncbi:MAG TPA: hypothetical protein VNB90_04295 [Cytophagaceae bacterium]|nr:hypothetical protein [Cytophagaceae bacterium]